MPGFSAPSESALTVPQMTRSSARQLVALVLMTGSLLSGCAHAPIQEMSDARQAVQSAREAGAGAYARPTLEQAEGDLNDAEGALKTYQFDLARGQALAAKERAGIARRVALGLRGAETALSGADRVGARDHEARELFDRAQDAARAGDASTAIDLADRARLEAERAVGRYYLETARRLLRDAEGQFPKMGPEDRARYEAAQAAVDVADGRRAYELARAFEGAAAPVSGRDARKRGSSDSTRE